MMGVELLGPLRQGEATLLVARVGQHLTEKSDGAAVHGVQFNGPLGCVAEALEFPLEEERLGQTEIGQVIGWRCAYGTPRGG